MQCLPWSEEFPGLLPPTLFGPWLKDCLSLRGANVMQGPIILPRGGPNRPVLRGDFRDQLDPDTRTGIFFPGQGEIGFAIYGWDRYRFTCSGIRMQDGAFAVTLGTAPMTANRLVKLPDQDCTLLADTGKFAYDATRGSVRTSADAKPYANSFTGSLVGLMNFCGHIQVWRRNVADDAYYGALLRFKGPSDSIVIQEDYGDAKWTTSGTPGANDVDFQIVSGELVMTVGSTAACELGYAINPAVQFYGVDP